jgi:hypothetical protein
MRARSEVRFGRGALVLIDRIAEIPQGTQIPKPSSTRNYTLKEVGVRGDARVVAFSIPRKNGKRETKLITEEQLEKAYSHFKATGSIDKAWWKANVSLKEDEGGCTFTSFGGLLIVLGEAERAGRGKYQLAPSPVIK